jgi:hypothetical protein
VNVKGALASGDSIATIVNTAITAAEAFAAFSTVANFSISGALGGKPPASAVVRVRDTVAELPR